MKYARLLPILHALTIAALLLLGPWLGGARALAAETSLYQADDATDDGSGQGTGEPGRPQTRAEYYQQIRNDLLTTVDRDDPRVALARLRELMKEDPAILRGCHPLTHQIGRRAYQRYHSFAEAVSYRDEICNSGYLHGVIEAHFLSVPDPLQAMREVCDPYPLGKFMSWQCYHGVGHGVMFVKKNDLPAALEMCGAYPRQFARATCVNGVFMENFNTDQTLHPSTFLNPNDPFYPCDEQAPEYQPDCYLYAPTYYLALHDRDYEGILQLCATAPGNLRGACTQGVGAQTMKENLDDPAFAEALCMRGENWQEQSCLSGMIGLYVNHYGAVEPARAMCDLLQSAHQASCVNQVKALEGMFS